MSRLIILTIATLFIAGCGNGNDAEAPAETQMAEEQTPATETRRELRRASDEPSSEPLPRTDDPARNIPRITGDAEVEGYGLTMIVDGSSPEAFRQSLEIIAEDSTEAQYRQLDSAIRYLRAYSPAGWEGLPSLYGSLDGMTGEEIIEEAERLSAERGGRRGRQGNQ